jgi:hypothetical protein
VNIIFSFWHTCRRARTQTHKHTHTHTHIYGGKESSEYKLNEKICLVTFAFGSEALWPLCTWQGCAQSLMCFKRAMEKVALVCTAKLGSNMSNDYNVEFGGFIMWRFISDWNSDTCEICHQLSLPFYFFSTYLHVLPFLSISDLSFSNTPGPILIEGPYCVILCRPFHSS